MRISLLAVPVRFSNFIISSHCGTQLIATDININSTYNSLIHSNFTSCQITADKSAYWTPQLYYQREDVSKTIVKVPSKGTTIYYLVRKSSHHVVDLFVQLIITARVEATMKPSKPFRQDFPRSPEQ